MRAGDQFQSSIGIYEILKVGQRAMRYYRDFGDQYGNYCTVKHVSGSLGETNFHVRDASDWVKKQADLTLQELTAELLAALLSFSEASAACDEANKKKIAADKRVEVATAALKEKL